MRKIALLALIAITSITACTKETLDTPTPDALCQHVTVSISLATIDATPTASRSVDESATQHINIYLFGESTTHIYAPTLATTITTELLPGEYTLYALANVEGDLGEETEAEVVELHATATSISELEAIPMSAHQSVTIPTSASRYTLPTISLTRCAAKVSYEIEVDESLSISLLSVSLHNLPTSCALFSDTIPDDYYDVESASAQSTTRHAEVVYIMENLQGSVDSITTQQGKCEANAPTYATYLQILAMGEGAILEYRVYLGENNTSDFNLRRNTHHSMSIIIRGEEAIDNRIRYYDGLYYGTANCIINTTNSVTFDATPYRTSESVNYRYTALYAGDEYEAARAELLWQDTKSLVTSVGLHGTEVEVTTSGSKGNAVVALYATDGTILWSFHIWCTATPATLTLAENQYGNTYEIMDRNLGATTTTAATTTTMGLFYQWGRKDPFVGADGITSRTHLTRYNIANEALDFDLLEYDASAISSQTVEFTIANPDRFLMGYTYFYYPITGYLNPLWGDSDKESTDAPKSVYDPSPEGYRVPRYDWFDAFKKRTSTSSSASNFYTYGDFNYGWHLYCDGAGEDATRTTYFHFAGARYGQTKYNGELSYTETLAAYWTSTPSSSSVIQACNIRLSSTYLYATTTSACENGHLIRCVRE